MKKNPVIVGLMLVFMCAHAAYAADLGHTSFLNEKKVHYSNVVRQKMPNDISAARFFFSCTVTVTGQIGIGSTSLSVSCAASGATCDAAASQAVSCVQSAVRAVKKAIL